MKERKEKCSFKRKRKRIHSYTSCYMLICLFPVCCCGCVLFLLWYIHVRSIYFLFFYLLMNFTIQSQAISKSLHVVPQHLKPFTGSQPGLHPLESGPYSPPFVCAWIDGGRAWPSVVFILRKFIRVEVGNDDDDGGVVAAAAVVENCRGSVEVAE